MAVIESHPKFTSIRNILVGNTPENNIDAERRMFLAGIFLIYDWLFHSRTFATTLPYVKERTWLVQHPPLTEFAYSPNP